MLPIILTKKQKVVIVGAGRACEIKLKVLSRVDCDITIVATQFPLEFNGVNFTKIVKDFYQLNATFFEDFDLIYIGIPLNDTSIVKQLLKTKMVNVLSNPSLSNFIHPCSRDDGDVLVSVNNLNKKDPKKACNWATQFIKYKNEHNN